LPTSRTDQAAFTLLEVIVMLAVLALAVGLVLPRFGDVGALSVDAAARELAATINLTRERAILGAHPLRMVLDADAGHWTIDGTERGALPARVHLRRITTGEASHGAGMVALDFDPTGDPLPARIDLVDDRGHAASVVVPPAGGRAVVRR
jgi:general secretion pathway protein H